MFSIQNLWNKVLGLSELHKRISIGILMIFIIGIPIIYGSWLFVTLLFVMCVFTVSEYISIVKKPCPKTLFLIAFIFSSMYCLRFSQAGLQKIILLSVVIAVFDSSAYFIGRSFGKHKLAPVISPNKTLEGFLGGVLIATVCAMPFHYIFSSGLGFGYYVLIVVTIGVLAQCGDLVESACKRKHGVKDSGNIIPGHGGILDRFDGYILTAPFFILLNIILEFANLNLFV